MECCNHCWHIQKELEEETVPVENEEGQPEDNAAGDNADGEDVQDEDTDGSPDI
ncbi:hypothetical protein A2U01_0028548 [Trifolium medium]|uniref:Uncharacterized protein n=1 Tax=Trifolium medium TaxID=97028 RepID=A0A392P7N0_9FABA|nr:hypothetical protein [Trifolium medium]